MNSFATNAFSAQNALCEKVSIKKAVNKIGEALEASGSGCPRTTNSTATASENRVRKTDN